MMRAIQSATFIILKLEARKRSDASLQGVSDDETACHHAIQYRIGIFMSAVRVENCAALTCSRIHHLSGYVGPSCREGALNVVLAALVMKIQHPYVVTFQRITAKKWEKNVLQHNNLTKINGNSCFFFFLQMWESFSPSWINFQHLESLEMIILRNWVQLLSILLKVLQTVQVPKKYQAQGQNIRNTPL